MRMRKLFIAFLVAVMLFAVSGLVGCESTPGTGGNTQRAEGIVNGFENVNDLYDVRFNVMDSSFSDNFKASVNTDKTYIKTGEGSLKFEYKYSATNPGFLFYGSKIPGLDLLDLKQVSIEVYNACEHDITAFFHMHQKDGSTNKSDPMYTETYTLTAGQWTTMTLTVNNVVMQYNSANVFGFGVEFKMQGNRHTDRYCTLYMDDFAVEYGAVMTEEDKAAKALIDNIIDKISNLPTAITAESESVLLEVYELYRDLPDKYKGAVTNYSQYTETVGKFISVLNEGSTEECATVLFLDKFVGMTQFRESPTYDETATWGYTTEEAYGDEVGSTYLEFYGDGTVADGSAYAGWFWSTSAVLSDYDYVEFAVKNATDKQLTFWWTWGAVKQVNPGDWILLRYSIDVFATEIKEFEIVPSDLADAVGKLYFSAIKAYSEKVEVISAEEAIALIENLPDPNGLTYGTNEINQNIAKIQTSYEAYGEAITNYGDFEAFYNVYKNLPSLLIDAATETNRFSYQVIDEGDKSSVYVSFGIQEQNDGIEYTSVEDETYGKVVEVRGLTGYTYCWVNFNTGISATELKTYWENGLANVDKIVFYVYNGQINPHKLSLMSHDSAKKAVWELVLKQGWNQVIVEKTAFMDMFTSGNPYLFIHLWNKAESDGHAGWPTGTVFRFTSFYGYTNEAWEKHLADQNAAEEVKAEEAIALIESLPATDGLTYRTYEVDRTVAKIQSAYESLGTKITNYSDFETFYNVYKTLPSLLIDAATEATRFSNTVVEESDKEPVYIAWGILADDKPISYTSVDDATYGKVIEINGWTGYRWSWVNFNTGMTATELKTYWETCLANVDKIVFYVYSPEANPHKLYIADSNLSAQAVSRVVLSQGWNRIIVEKSAFLDTLATGNPYVFINLWNAIEDNGEAGWPEGKTFRFSSFYGYTNAAWEKYLADQNAAEEAKLEEAIELIQSLPSIDNLAYGTYEIDQKITKIQAAYEIFETKITNYADFEEFYEVYKTLPYLLIDAATEANKFSSDNYIADTDKDASTQLTWGAGHPITAATVEDETYGKVIEASSVAGYIWGWINFNTGRSAEDTETYWKNNLANVDKIVFHVYNSETKTRLHRLYLASANFQSQAIADVKLNPGWNKVVIEKTAFLNVFTQGNPYLFINFKNSDDSDNGGGNCTFKFTSFYGYTNEAYDALMEEALKPIVLIDAATEANKFSSDNYIADTDKDASTQLTWGAGHPITTATANDETYGNVIEASGICGYKWAWVNFNTGIEATALKTYWENKLANVDKIVFYVHNPETKQRLHRLWLTSANFEGQAIVDVKLNPGWNKVVIEKDAFLEVFAKGNPYLFINFRNSDDSENGGQAEYTFKFSSFYGYTDEGYAAAFPSES